MYSATMGVDSLGLNTMVLPAINAGVMCPLGKCNGKLKGPITDKTPWDEWGKKIIALNTDVTSEVLRGYKGLTLLDKCYKNWELELQTQLNHCKFKKYEPFTPPYETGWKSFFKNII